MNLNRKEMKKNARLSVRKHYWIMMAVCLIAILLGTEFSGSLDFMRFPSTGRLQQIENQEETIASSEFGMKESSVWNVVEEVLEGNLQQGQEDADTLRKNTVASSKEKGNVILGRSNGVLAEIVNGVTSGIFFVEVVNGFYRVGLSKDAVFLIVLCLVLLVGIGFWFFIKNLYKAIARRIFLECRTYEKVPIQRLLFFMRAKKWVNACVNMFMEFFFLCLWSLTIVGGPIKFYSYYLVPYIVAENPEICWRDSIALSRRMMNGHKWECFTARMSFLPWDLLGMATMGASNLFYGNSYRTAFFAEYYAQLRSQAKLDKISGTEFLNDVYLFEKASAKKLRKAYRDVIDAGEDANDAIRESDEEVKEEVVAAIDNLQGSDEGKQAAELSVSRLAGFFEKNFGIVLYRTENDKKYWEYQAKLMIAEAAEDAVCARTYPDRLSPNPIHQSSNHFKKMHYLRHYTVSSLILMFFLFSFVGWAWEVSLHVLEDGVFVNRGVLHGPWLPIYGSGGVLILTLLYRFRRSPGKEFAATVLVCGVVEYFTSFFMEMYFGGTRWWDYSGYFLNLNGRICAEGLFVFGVGGMAFVYLVAPAIDNWIRKLKPKMAVCACVVLIGLFAWDQVYSFDHPNMGKGITSSTTQALSAADSADATGPVNSVSPGQLEPKG